MDNGTLVSTQQLPGMGVTQAEMIQRLCALAGVDLMEMQRCLLEYKAQCGQLRQRCCDIEARYKTVADLLVQANCPTNVLYSEVTTAEYSDDNQVELTNVVTGLGGDYVDAVPVPPGKRIRLEQLSRPGYRPTTITFDVSMANNGVNYLDLEIQFFIIPGGQSGGKPYGPKFRGNQFLNKNGTQIHLPWPMYQGKPLTVGSLERLAVEIKHGGAQNNIDSIYATVLHDADCAYNACRTPSASTAA